MSETIRVKIKTTAANVWYAIGSAYEVRIKLLNDLQGFYEVVGGINHEKLIIMSDCEIIPGFAAEKTIDTSRVMRMIITADTGENCPFKKGEVYDMVDEGVSWTGVEKPCSDWSIPKGNCQMALKRLQKLDELNDEIKKVQGRSQNHDSHYQQDGIQSIDVMEQIVVTNIPRSYTNKCY